MSHDTESGLYYLNSRYYNPEICRFISADSQLNDDILGNNLFTYCGNNPISRSDEGGQFWDTVLDVASLAFSIVDVAMNPDDPWAWIGLAGDVIDLIPFVTCVGEVAKGVRAGVKVADAVWDGADMVYDSAKIIDGSTDVIQIAKASDFTEEAADMVKALDRSSGFTKSTASAGIKIHKGYKTGNGFNPDWKEYKGIKGIRPDYIDFDNKIIYELKPMNLRSVRSGIRQLQKYNKALGGGFTMRLELY